MVLCKLNRQKFEQHRDGRGGGPVDIGGVVLLGWRGAGLCREMDLL